MKSKITLVYRDVENNIAEETLWANLLEDGNYQIDNIPFYAPNLSNKDIIAVEDDEGILYFDELINPSGHSTIQIIFYDDQKSKKVLSKLEEIGCSWEGIKNQSYYAVDIPSETDFNEVRRMLEMNNDILDYKEACVSQNHS